ncbi:MAG: SDR family oxidoreductase [Acidobacteria bacterium]|nr:SDR family oxidoreductase [Acidobacteriota bacterium]
MNSPHASRPIVLVTGAAKRVGRAIAKSLAAADYQVLIHYNGSRLEAEKTAEECGGAELFQADLGSVDAIRGLFQEVRERVGRLDAFVANAARFTKFNVLDITEQDWDFIHDVNLKATFFCCQQAAKLILDTAGKGRIVTISSGGGIRPWPEHVHYCAAKAGVIHMTRAMAVALAPQISVNSVAPGVIPFGEENDPPVAALIARTPAGRAGLGSEIGEAVLSFLQASRFTTGQVLSVDGGLALR